MPSACGTRRNRRNRRSHGGAQMGANLQEAFADLKGDAPKPPAAAPAAPAAPAANGAAQKGGRRNRRKSHGGGQMGANLQEAFADLKGKDGFANAPKPPADMPKPAAPPAAAAQKGGRRKSGKTRKMSSGAKAWTTAVTKLYREMKAKDKSVRFGDALKRASALKKKGQL